MIKRLKLSSADATLIFLGWFAAFSLAAHQTILFFLFSIIGLPIAIGMHLAPPIFTVWLSIRLAYAFFSYYGIDSWPRSIATGLAILAIIPLIQNIRTDFITQPLTTNDKKLASGDFNARRLAIVMKPSSSYHQGDTLCDDFCQRALMNGTVDRIITITEYDRGVALNPWASGTSFRMEHRGQCPDMKLRAGVRTIRAKRDPKKTNFRRTTELMREQIASGNCLIQEAGTLGFADGVIVMKPLVNHYGGARGMFNPFSLSIKSGRISYYERENNTLVERARATGVSAKKLFPLLIPTIVHGTQFSTWTELARYDSRSGTATRYSDIPDLKNFYETILNLDLSINRDSSIQQSNPAPETQRIITRALDAPGSIPRTTIRVIDDFIWNTGTRDSSDSEAAELALRILSDERVPIPRHAYSPVQRFARNDIALAERFAEVLFARLSTIDPQESDDEPNYNVQRATYLGSTYYWLPDEVMLPYRKQLEQLAHDHTLRVPMYKALTKLHVFGAEAVPTLLYLIDDAERFTSTRNGRKVLDNDWQHPYLAGLQGLCKMGPRGEAAIPHLFQQLHHGKLAIHGSYMNLMVQTLVSLGADGNDIWQNMSAGNKKISRKRFNRELSRANRHRDCSY